MTNIETYRPKSPLIIAGIGAVMNGLFVWSSFYQGGTTSEVTSIFTGIFILACIYLVLVRPKVTFSDEGVIICNPIEDFTIGWADVIQLDAKWAMVIETKDFTVSAWAATAPGRHRNKTVHVNEITGLDIDLDGSIRPADSPNSDSGAATYRARIRIKKFQNTPGAISLQTQRVRQLKPVIIGAIALIGAIGTNFLGH
ncbi:MAG: hypothetical protein WCO95_05165 [Actinomycetes bacterium]